MWGGKSSQDSVGFDKGRAGHNESHSLVELLLDVYDGRCVVLVPGADRGDHAARVQGKGRHQLYRPPRRLARSRLVRSTVVVLSAGTFVTGCATSRRPCRCNFTVSG